MSERTETHCPYCALQCGMQLTPADGTVSAEPLDFPTNRGGLCQKGWTAPALLRATDRITTPLVRDASGELRPTSWEQAYGRIVDGVRAAQARRGPDAVAVFGGGGLTNEKAYSLGKFARIALGTRLIDSTPPARISPSKPERTRIAAWLTASSPEAQKRLSCTPATVSG